MTIEPLRSESFSSLGANAQAFKLRRITLSMHFWVFSLFYFGTLLVMVLVQVIASQHRRDSNLQRQKVVIIFSKSKTLQISACYFLINLRHLSLLDCSKLISFVS